MAARTPVSAASIDAPRRVEICHPLTYLDLDDGIEIAQARLGGAPIRRGLGRLRAHASSVEQRPPHADADVPGRLPLVLNGKDAQIRPRHVVAGDGCQHRQAAGRSGGDALLGGADAKKKRLPFGAARARLVDGSLGADLPAFAKATAGLAELAESRSAATVSCYSIATSCSRPTSLLNSADVVSTMFSASMLSIR